MLNGKTILDIKTNSFCKDASLQKLFVMVGFL